MANTHSLDFELSSSQYASITDASQTGLDPGGDFTIEMWVKLESLPADGGTRFLLVSKLDTSPLNGYLIRYRNSSGVYSFQFNIASGGTQTAGDVTYTLSTGVWTHLAFACDASAADIEIYVNTSSIGTFNGSGITTIGNATAPFYIGGDPVQSAYYDGLMDEVRFWNDIRTQPEIAANYNKELTGSEANLVSYWKLNNNYTDVVSGNTLTATNSPVFVADVPFTGAVADNLSLLGVS